MDQQISLADLEIGDIAVIESVRLENPLLKRVYDLGFLPDVSVKCVQKAPAGSPIAFAIKSSVVALRKNDANRIICRKQTRGNI